MSDGERLQELLETELFAAWLRGVSGNDFYTPQQLVEILTSLLAKVES